VAYKELVDVGLAEGYGMFVAVLGDGTGKVIGINSEGKGEETAVKGLWEFSESVSWSFLLLVLFLY
jgi:ER membrane protein complex subunit 1